MSGRHGTIEGSEGYREEAALTGKDDSVQAVSILYQYKKSGNGGGETSKHRNPRQLMIKLSTVNWQFRKSGDGCMGQSQWSRKNVGASDMSSLKSKFGCVNGEFGAYLKEEACKIERLRGLSNLSDNRAHHCSVARKTRDLKFQIERGLEEYQESALSEWAYTQDLSGVDDG